MNVRVMSQNSTEPSRGPLVVIEEPTEPRPTANPVMFHVSADVHAARS